MTVAASGTLLTYQWYVLDNTQGFIAISGATTTSLTVSPSATATYYVAVMNVCRTITSDSVLVSVNGCTSPGVTASLNLNPNQTVTLAASPRGTGPFTYTWYRASDNAVVGGTETLTLGPITVTTSYYVTVTTPSCGTATSATVTAIVPLIMPSGLVATKTGPAEITITWLPVSGAGRYHLERRSGSGWTDLTAATIWTGTSWIDSSLAANTTFAYRVWASPDAANSTKSNYSNTDVATTMTFTTVTAGVTTINASVMEELRTAVNAVRAAAGWSAVTWDDMLGPGQPLPDVSRQILGAHILALRGRMNEGLQALGVVIGGYTDPDPSLKTIRAIHITELQRRAQ